MQTSQSNAALPLSHPPSPEPGVTRYDLTGDGRVLYVIHDRHLRRTEVSMPAELATEATETHIERWLDNVASVAHGRPAVPTPSATPSACRVLPFPARPADPGP